MARLEHDLIPRLVSLLALAAIGCSDDAAVTVHDASTCLPELSLDCDTLYLPTWDKIFDNRIGSTCGSSSATGKSCHAPEGAMAGLVLATKDGAYDALLGTHGGVARVIPGDPACSLLMQRLESDDASVVMPPGRKLSEEERCSIRQWIANGAKR